MINKSGWDSQESGDVRDRVRKETALAVSCRTWDERVRNELMIRDHLAN